MNVLAIDQGTSATKALVIGDDRAVLGDATVALHPVASADGGVEQDPEELWRSVVDAGRAALARAAVAIDAVALANQGETVLAWDRRTGAPCSVALSWQDRRASTVCDRLRAHAERLTATTGLPLDPYFAAPKIAWLREHLTRDGVATTTDAWLLHRLTGAFVTDAATASRTLLLAIDEVAWSPDACALFGIAPESLPRITDCAAIVGETRAFGADVPVAGVCVDQQAALYAQACLAKGDAKCTYGTGAFILATTGSTPSRSAARLASSVAWRLDGRATYCLDGQVYTAGAAVEWLRRVGLVEDAMELDGLALAAPARSDVLFVPALAGLAAPFWRPAAHAAFLGLSLATERADLARAVLDGIAAQVAILAGAIATDLGRPLSRLRVDGGLTRSRALMQAQADLLQAPVEVYPSPDATAHGVAALARLGAGAAATSREAIGEWRPAAVYEPMIPAAEAATRLERWRRAAERATEL